MLQPSLRAHALRLSDLLVALFEGPKTILYYSAQECAKQAGDISCTMLLRPRSLFDFVRFRFAGEAQGHETVLDVFRSEFL